MRSLPIGWALPIEAVEDRRAWTAELSRATHPGREAVVAARIGSALAAWALEDAPRKLLLEIARDEASAAVRSEGADARIEAMLAAIEAGTWRPDAGVGDMDPYETVARVVWAIMRPTSMADAILGAVRLGGDTDTVAAIAGGLLACQRSPAEVRGELPWLDEVDVPVAERIVGVGQGLAELRVRLAGG
jgi:ADP-ribosylglycohydrolase